jgi:hypothetical protein
MWNKDLNLVNKSQWRDIDDVGYKIALYGKATRLGCDEPCDGEEQVNHRSMNRTKPCEGMNYQLHSFIYTFMPHLSAIDKWAKVECSMLKHDQVAWTYGSCEASQVDEYKAINPLWILLKPKDNFGYMCLLILGEMNVQMINCLWYWKPSTRKIKMTWSYSYWYKFYIFFWV